MEIAPLLQWSYTVDQQADGNERIVWKRRVSGGQNESSGSKQVWCVLARVLPPLLWSARRQTPWWAQPVGWRSNSHLRATAESWRWVRGSFHLECSSAAVSNREEKRRREGQTSDTFTGWKRKWGKQGSVEQKPQRLIRCCCVNELNELQIKYVATAAWNIRL